MEDLRPKSGPPFVLFLPFSPFVVFACDYHLRRVSSLSPTFVAVNLSSPHTHRLLLSQASALKQVPRLLPHPCSQKARSPQSPHHILGLQSSRTLHPPGPPGVQTYI